MTAATGQALQSLFTQPSNSRTCACMQKATIRKTEPKSKVKHSMIHLALNAYWDSEVPSSLELSLLLHVHFCNSHHYMSKTKQYFSKNQTDGTDTYHSDEIQCNSVMVSLISVAKTSTISDVHVVMWNWTPLGICDPEINSVVFLST